MGGEGSGLANLILMIAAIDTYIGQPFQTELGELATQEDVLKVDRESGLAWEPFRAF